MHTTIIRSVLAFGRRWNSAATHSHTDLHLPDRRRYRQANLEVPILRSRALAFVACLLLLAACDDDPAASADGATKEDIAQLQATITSLQSEVATLRTELEAVETSANANTSTLSSAEGNLASLSGLERMVFTPISVVLAALAWRVAVGD